MVGFVGFCSGNVSGGYVYIRWSFVGYVFEFCGCYTCLGGVA